MTQTTHDTAARANDGRGSSRSDLVAEACRTIELALDEPDLAALAAAAGLSRFHFHRVFKAETGVTPKQYAQAARSARVRAELEAGANVTDVIYAAGFRSSGRFYASSTERLGMKPTEYRDGAKGVAVRFAVAACSLGTVLVAATAKGVSAVELGDDPDAMIRDFQDRFAAAELIGADREFEDLVAAVVGLVEHPGSNPELPLDVRGTAFQERVWRALREVHSGTTTTYAALARDIGAPTTVRAVRACVHVQSGRARGPVPSGDSDRRLAVGLSMGSRAQGRAAPARGGVAHSDARARVARVEAAGVGRVPVDPRDRRLDRGIAPHHLVSLLTALQRVEEGRGIVVEGTRRVRRHSFDEHDLAREGELARSDAVVVLPRCGAERAARRAARGRAGVVDDDDQHADRSHGHGQQDARDHDDGTAVARLRHAPHCRR